jgi:hypothetical protein
MIQLTEELINAAAPNQSAITNAWGLVKKNSFINCSIDKESTIIFAECKGSGAKNYILSADFIRPEAPVFRCSCPSRQFPCKHTLGLMYAFFSGHDFAAAEIPADIQEKRQKATQLAERKSVPKDDKPKKVNQTALLKKRKAQLEGLERMEKLVNSIAKTGLGTVNAQTIKALEAQAKEFGNYYIPGVQTALQEFLFLFKDCENPEEIYTTAVESLVKLHVLCKKGQDYLKKRIENPEISDQDNLAIEELLGHAWQLAELSELGLEQQDAELVQLSFNSFTDEARREFVDAGIWLNFSSGQLQRTYTYRPFKAAKHIKEEDSFFSVLNIKQLYIYPGGINHRVRWDEATVRELSKADYTRIKAAAHTSLAQLVKTIKNQIKDPLADKFPLALIHFARLGEIGDQYVLEDSAGQRLALTDYREDQGTTANLSTILQKYCKDQVLLVMFHHNLDTQKLQAQPLSLITDDAVLRFMY